MVRQPWWRYQEGLFLIGTLVISGIVAGYCGWLYQRTMPVLGTAPVCNMHVLLLLMMLLLLLYALPFLGWQVALVRRRLAGKPLTAWGVVAFLGSLLPVFHIGYTVLAM